MRSGINHCAPLNAMLRAGSPSIYAGIFVSILSNAAAAQQMQGCEEHGKIVRRLETKFHEERAEVGTNQYGWLIELFESADGRTWTLVATRPGGPACVFGVGGDWQIVAPVKGNPS